jgi:hypothetical protein
MTYRLCVIGEEDGVVYSVKEFEAADSRQAALLAEELVGPEASWWDGQRLTTRLLCVDPLAA